MQRTLVGGFVIYRSVFPCVSSVGRMNKVGWGKWMPAL